MACRHWGGAVSAWASLEGWHPDPDRPGYLRDPSRPGWARDLDGHWYSQADIDNAKRAAEEAGKQLELDERILRAAREVLGR